MIPRVPLAVEDHHAGPLRRGEPTVQESPVTRAEPGDLDRRVPRIPFALGITQRVEEEGVDQRSLWRTWNGGLGRLRRRVEFGGNRRPWGLVVLRAIATQGRHAASWASRWRSACHAIATRCLSASKSATACVAGSTSACLKRASIAAVSRTPSEAWCAARSRQSLESASKRFGPDDEQDDCQPDQDPPERQPQPQLPHAWGLEGGASSRRL